MSKQRVGNRWKTSLACLGLVLLPCFALGQLAALTNKVPALYEDPHAAVTDFTSSSPQVVVLLCFHFKAAALLAPWAPVA